MVLSPLFPFLCTSTVSNHTTTQHLGRALENRRAVSFCRILPSPAILDCTYILKVTPLEKQCPWTPLFRGLRHPSTPGEKQSSPLDFRPRHPDLHKPLSLWAKLPVPPKPAGLLSQLEGGLAQQGDGSWHLEHKLPVLSPLKEYPRKQHLINSTPSPKVPSYPIYHLDARTTHLLWKFSFVIYHLSRKKTSYFANIQWGQGGKRECLYNVLVTFRRNMGGRGCGKAF